MTLSARIAALEGPDRAVDAGAFKEQLLDVLQFEPLKDDWRSTVRDAIEVLLSHTPEQEK